MDLLKRGEIIALPTETVYGLAANALDPAAVARVFEVKGRPANNPVIVHVGSMSMARECVSHWTETAEKLAEAFWPGPLTLVLPKSKQIPDIVTAGGLTAGIRWPNHQLTQAVIQACGFPLAVPSANVASALSPTTAEHVRKNLDGKIPLIVDGGPAGVGIESTVLDLTSEPPRVLRPGMIHAESLDAVLGSEQVTEEGGDSQASAANGQPLRSPGQLPKHYAPKARLEVWLWPDAAALKSSISKLGVSTSKTYIIAHTGSPSNEGFGGVSVLPRNPEAFARAIYAELHSCDQRGAELIVVEAVPEEAAWHGIADRLRRAASRFE